MRVAKQVSSYHIKGTPAKLVGTIDAPDAEAAIAEQENVPPNERGRLLV